MHVDALFLQEPDYVDIPRPVKEFLAGAGVLNALPWDGQPAVAITTNIPYCQPPADQSYDWDYSSDTLDDAVEGHTNNDTVNQVPSTTVLLTHAYKTAALLLCLLTSLHKCMHCFGLVHKFWSTNPK